MIKHGLEVAGVFTAFDIAKEGVRKLGEQIGDVVKVTEAHQFVAAQTNQVLKSTKDVSGETAGSLNDLADAPSQTTGFSHNTVPGRDNLPLPFPHFGQRLFPQPPQPHLHPPPPMSPPF